MHIYAPAKLNLYLKVIGERQDGYHEILSLMVPISLFDEIYIEKLDHGIKFDCDDSCLPKDERNLAVKAAKLYLEKTGIREGIYIQLKKNIPIAAGLGGGSSNAASILKALNRIYNKIPEEELLKLAVYIGADVPFFLKQTPCLAKGIGEILEPLPHRPISFLVITPHIHISTGWVYSQFKLDLTKSEQSSIKNLWERGNIEAILYNDLEKVTIKHFPVISEIKDLLIKKGAKGVLMSGSGPTVFGVFESEEIAYRAKNELSTDRGKVFVVSSLSYKNWGVAKR